VPADRSSPIPAALTQPAHAQPLHDSEPPPLPAYLTSVSDPRAARGRRHPLVAILSLAAAAVLAGARSITAIAEWAADAPQPGRAALGARHHAPGHRGIEALHHIREVTSAEDASQVRTGTRPLMNQAFPHLGEASLVSRVSAGQPRRSWSSRSVTQDA
jgi:hypothetical protein